MPTILKFLAMKMNYNVDENMPLLVSKIAALKSIPSEFSLWFIHDSTGWFLSSIVWTVLTVPVFAAQYTAQEGSLESYHVFVVSGLTFLALWSHIKTMLTNPGTIPFNAEPVLADQDRTQVCCEKCQCYKPPRAHHGMNLKCLLSDYLSSLETLLAR